MTLKCKRGTDRNVDNIGPGPTPPGMSQIGWGRSRPEGRSESKALGWYRGQHSGWIDAVLVLQEMGHTRIAEKLQKHFNLNDEGDIGE